MTQRIEATVNTDHRLFEDSGRSLRWGWEDFQGVTVLVTILLDPPRRVAAGVQGRENADGRCATWDSPVFPVGTEAYDLAEAWLNDEIPSEVYLDWLRENDTTGELEALLEEELKCTA